MKAIGMTRSAIFTMRPRFQPKADQVVLLLVGRRSIANVRQQRTIAVLTLATRHPTHPHASTREPVSIALACSRRFLYPDDVAIVDTLFFATF